MVDTVSASSTTAQTLSAKTAQSAESAITDFDDFLTLLTAQLENQDPLNPMDSTQFVEQLATFASVEQAIGSNTRLDAILAQGEEAALHELAGWIGREVNASGVGFAFDGESLAIDVPADADASTASVTIADMDGKTVATLAADAKGGTVTWTGETINGTNAAAGNYQVSYTYGYADADPVTVEATGYAEVTEARAGEDGVELVLSTGATVAASNVTAVREAQTADTSAATDEAEIF
ncbi:MAG: hypothetical protein MRY63_10700 [Neomegalonema sp.]|nr:hypothetical protein [Neomegalonema sp.]